MEKKYELINITLNTLINKQKKSIDFLEMINNCWYNKLNDQEKKISIIKRSTDTIDEENEYYSSLKYLYII